MACRTYEYFCTKRSTFVGDGATVAAGVAVSINFRFFPLPEAFLSVKFEGCAFGAFPLAFGASGALFGEATATFGFVTEILNHIYYINSGYIH